MENFLPFALPNIGEEEIGENRLHGKVLSCNYKALGQFL
jgi:hypothetical protein